MSHRQRERHGVEKDGDKQNAKTRYSLPAMLYAAPLQFDFSRER
ncbi:hypothetical protein [Escherichia coli ISC41]|nr:hypothetical protein [Escherichia coli ISC41]